MKQDVVDEKKVESKQVLGDHRDQILKEVMAVLGSGQGGKVESMLESLKDKQWISSRMRDFDVGSIVLNEET